ncbi:unnamed protein product [Kuraishia capsulata CBS 1993]|uniref:Inheritance of peroxisomes protein 1 n=1 Tax=Kuraishia capsulata CBS 1993 TaxID=1382522 RepID=W6MPI9_9ASCO|nr:uncharacterized protein KUCA_T00003004001 [Kuraishia capsulata CBS 1993]CDK27027.1 unnamed protein product [Kuraishia capsulata CBS 1993]
MMSMRSSSGGRIPPGASIETSRSFLKPVMDKPVEERSVARRLISKFNGSNGGSNSGSNSGSETSNNTLSRISQLSPRKKTLARRKLQQEELLKSSSSKVQPRLVARRPEVKPGVKTENKPQNKPQNTIQPSEKPQKPVQSTHTKSEVTQLPALSKRVLFRFDHATVTSHNSQTPEKSVSHGKLLTSGKLEIYKLHNDAVTYLECGNVTYPIMSRSRIMRTDINKFILTVSNPPSFWHIRLKTRDRALISTLEQSIIDLCDYANFYDHEEDEDGDDDQEQDEDTNDVSTIKVDDSLPQSHSLQRTDSSVACFGLNSDSAQLELAKLTLSYSNDSLDSLLDLFDIDVTKRVRKVPNLFRTPEASPHTSIGKNFEPVDSSTASSANEYKDAQDTKDTKDTKESKDATAFSLIPLTPQSMDPHDGQSWLSPDEQDDDAEREFLATTRTMNGRSFSSKVLYSYINDQSRRMATGRSDQGEVKLNEDEIFNSVRRRINSEQQRSTSRVSRLWNW